MFVQYNLDKACTANSGSPFAIGKVDGLDEMCNLHSGDKTRLSPARHKVHVIFLDLAYISF